MSHEEWTCWTPLKCCMHCWLCVVGDSPQNIYGHKLRVWGGPKTCFAVINYRVLNDSPHLWSVYRRDGDVCQCSQSLDNLGAQRFGFVLPPKLTVSSPQLSPPAGSAPGCLPSGGGRWPAGCSGAYLPAQGALPPSEKAWEGGLGRLPFHQRSCSIADPWGFWRMKGRADLRDPRKCLWRHFGLKWERREN